MAKPRQEKLFGPMKVMPELALKSPKKKKAKKEPTMLEYHKERTKKMGLM